MQNLDPYKRIKSSLRKIGLSKVVQPGGKLGFGQWPRKVPTVLLKEDKEFVNLLLATFPQSTMLDLLDAGCGNGLVFLAFLHALQQHKVNVRVHAHLRDIQDEAIHEAVRNYGGLTENILLDAQVGDITRLNLSDASLHGAIIKSVFGWLSTTEAVVQTIHELRRTIKKNGLVLVSVMTPYNQVGIGYGNFAKRDDMWNKINKNGVEISAPLTIFSNFYGKNIILFTKNALVRLFSQHGFMVERSKYFRNTSYSNQFSNQYPENLRVIARRI